MNGILLIEKPINMTSRDLVNKVSYILNVKKIGHTGTLDPMASGVMIICIGKATKISNLITNYDKKYIAEITLGLETDTLDLEGNVINEEKVSNINEEKIQKVLVSFIGTYKQQVPKYSAVKIKGKKLYEYARNNIEIELPIREVKIYQLNIISNLIDDNNKLKFMIQCHVSKGTYIRSLIRDIGKQLNTIACMSKLKRIQQGKYTIEDCNSLDDIKTGKYKIINLYDALKHLPITIISDELESKIKNGAVLKRFFDSEISVIVNTKKEVLAIYQIYNKDKSKVKPLKILV